MQEAAQAGNLVGHRSGRWSLAAVAAAVAFLVADVWLKRLALAGAAGPDWGWFRFELFLNTGIVFSLPVPQWVSLPLTLLVLAGFCVALFTAAKRRSPSAVGLTFVVLGALSNVADRLEHQATVDYLIFFGRSAINLADVMIVAGALMLILATKGKRLR